MEVGLSSTGKCRCKVSKYYTVEKCVKSFERRPRNPSIFNIIRWVAGSLGRTTHGPIVIDVGTSCQLLFYDELSLQQKIL